MLRFGMEQIFNFLGFTDTANTLWNLLGYVAMVLVIIAVLSDKWRNRFLALGTLGLLTYAGLYLHDPILAGLQFIALTSAILNLLNIKKPVPSIIIILTVIVFSVLLLTGQISGLWPWVGALGLWGIALGISFLPHKRGFAVMALGGALIVVYAWVLHIWVFFVLNIAFFGANIFEFKKK